MNGQEMKNLIKDAVTGLFLKSNSDTPIEAKDVIATVEAVQVVEVEAPTKEVEATTQAEPALTAQYVTEMATAIVTEKVTGFAANEVVEGLKAENEQVRTELATAKELVVKLQGEVEGLKTVNAEAINQEVTKAVASVRQELTEEVKAWLTAGKVTAVSTTVEGAAPKKTNAPNFIAKRFE